jgi:hypothetical protein
MPDKAAALQKRARGTRRYILATETKTMYQRRSRIPKIEDLAMSATFAKWALVSPISS